MEQSTFLTEARVGESTETPLFFGKAGCRKFAIFHRPVDVDRAEPILLCHPLLEEKLWAHRVLLDFARRAAGRGHSVLRFDLRGHGDSDGEFEDFGFDAAEQDTTEAWEFVRERTGRDPVAVGLRIGATLAARVAARKGGRTVLWEPVLDLQAALFETLRTHLTFQLRQHGKVQRNRQQLVKDLEAGGSVVIEGYGLTGGFWSEAIAAGGLQDGDFPGRCAAVLVVGLSRQAPHDDAPLPTRVRSWAAGIRSDFVHVPEEPFWSDIRRYRTQAPKLAELTLDWIAGGAMKGAGT